MRRRAFIAAIGGSAIAWPHGVGAQSSNRMRRIGMLFFVSSTDQDQQTRSSALLKALEQLGWTDGGNVRVDTRSAAGDVDRLWALARELVSLAPDVIFCATSATLTALREETQTIPIVFAGVSDPVGQGFVANLAHPGGNLTGFTAFDSAMGSKWLELLKQTVPAIARVTFIFNPKTGPTTKRSCV